ncbi:Spy/CpxP family protein refolding chaperone [bacterium]
MKHWIQIALVLSLAFNFGFLGAFIYRMIEKQPVQQIINPLPAQHQTAPKPIHEPPKQAMDKPILAPEQRRELHEIRQAFQPKIKRIRQELMREKRALGDLLFNGESDSVIIEQQIEKIGELEMSMEKEIIFELLRESQVLAPEERAAFIRMALKRIDGNKQRSQNPPNRLPNRNMRQQPNPDKQRQRRNQP